MHPGPLAQALAKGKEMSDQAPEGRAEIRRRALAILGQPGGIEALIRDPDGRSTKETLVLLILNEDPERAPPPAELQEKPADPDTAFVERVRGKLQWQLRHLADLPGTATRRQRQFLNAVSRLCQKTNAERDGRYCCRAPFQAGLWKLDCFEARRQDGLQKLAERWGHQPPLPPWWDMVLRRMPSRQARLMVLLAPWVSDPDQIDSILKSDGTLDVDRVAGILQCTRREVAEMVATWRKEIPKVQPIVPHPFASIYRRLKELASTSLGGLADLQLREKLFDLSRDLAFSFDPESTIAPGAKRIDNLEFEAAIDLLLSEWEFSEQTGQRAILERLMTTARRVCDALEGADIDRAFSHSALFVLDAGRMQHHVSPSRPHVLLAYAYFLWMGGWGQAYLRANEAIADRCNAIVRAKGVEVLDLPPEFERGATLRRVRTYAGVNQVSWLFYHTFTTARQQRFVVKDYEGLASLVGRLGQLIRDDPRADTVFDEQLVVRAHLVRAAYNERRRAKDNADQERWKRTEAQWRTELRELLDNHFLSSDRSRRDAQALVERVGEAAEGFAVERTLDIVTEAMGDLPEIVDRIRAERQSLCSPPPGPL